MTSLAKEGMTKVVATHEMAYAKKTADRVVFMDQGVIVAQGDSEQVLTNPQNDRTKQFLHRVLDV